MAQQNTSKKLQVMSTKNVWSYIKKVSDRKKQRVETMRQRRVKSYLQLCCSLLAPQCGSSTYPRASIHRQGLQMTK